MSYRGSCPPQHSHGQRPIKLLRRHVRSGQLMKLRCRRALNNNQWDTIPVIPSRESVSTISAITRSGQSCPHSCSHFKMMDCVWKEGNFHFCWGGVMIKLSCHSEGARFCLNCHFLPIANIDRNNLRQLIGRRCDRVHP